MKLTEILTKNVFGKDVVLKSRFKAQKTQKIFKTRIVVC